MHNVLKDIDLTGKSWRLSRNHVLGIRRRGHRLWHSWWRWIGLLITIAIYWIRWSTWLHSPALRILGILRVCIICHCWGHGWDAGWIDYSSCCLLLATDNADDSNNDAQDNETNDSSHHCSNDCPNGYFIIVVVVTVVWIIVAIFAAPNGTKKNGCQYTS